MLLARALALPVLLARSLAEPVTPCALLVRSARPIHFPRSQLVLSAAAVSSVTRPALLHVLLVQVVSSRARADSLPVSHVPSVRARRSAVRHLVTLVVWVCSLMSQPSLRANSVQSDLRLPTLVALLALLVQLAPSHRLRVPLLARSVLLAPTPTPLHQPLALNAAPALSHQRSALPLALSVHLELLSRTLAPPPVSPALMVPSLPMLARSSASPALLEISLDVP